MAKSKFSERELEQIKSIQERRKKLHSRDLFARIRAHVSQWTLAGRKRFAHHRHTVLFTSVARSASYRNFNSSHGLKRCDLEFTPHISHPYSFCDAGVKHVFRQKACHRVPRKF